MNKIDFKPSVMLNPVPAVMISSRNKEGKDNIFTVSWVNTICTRPPMLSISIRPERLSYDYIKESMEFIVNIPCSDLTYETDYCGVKTGKKIDKIKELNLEMVEGSHVNASYIKKCPVTIECRVKNIIPLGSHDLFIADVLGSHVNENLLDEKGKLHFEFGNLITYSHGEYFPMSKTPIGHFGFSTKMNKEDSMKLQNKPQTIEQVNFSDKKSSKKKKNNDIKNLKQSPQKRNSKKSNSNKKKSK
ncbi:MAG: flavin reductase family protein [Sarcina sp.]